MLLMLTVTQSLTSVMFMDFASSSFDLAEFFIFFGLATLESQ